LNNQIIVTGQNLPEVTPTILAGTARLVCDPIRLTGWGTPDLIGAGRAYKIADRDAINGVSIRSVLAAGPFLCFEYALGFDSRLTEEQIEDALLGHFAAFALVIEASGQAAKHCFVDEWRCPGDVRRMCFIRGQTVDLAAELDLVALHGLDLNPETGRLVAIGQEEGVRPGQGRNNVVMEVNPTTLKRTQTIDFGDLGSAVLTGVAVGTQMTAVLRQNSRGQDVLVQTGRSAFEVKASNVVVSRLFVDRRGEVVGTTRKVIVSFDPGSGSFRDIAALDGKLFACPAYAPDGSTVLVRASHDGRSWDFVGPQ